MGNLCVCFHYSPPIDRHCCRRNSLQQINCCLVAGAALLVPGSPLLLARTKLSATLRSSNIWVKINLLVTFGETYMALVVLRHLRLWDQELDPNFENPSYAFCIEIERRTPRPLRPARAWKKLAWTAIYCFCKSVQAVTSCRSNSSMSAVIS